MIEVAAGIVQNAEGKILLCQRTGELEGFWEFPGGKRESAESFSECLGRELLEELSLEVEVSKEICRMVYEPKGTSLLFSFLLAFPKEKSPLRLSVHQDARWVRKDEIPGYSLCPADANFVRAGWLERME